MRLRSGGNCYGQGRNPHRGPGRISTEGLALARQWAEETCLSGLVDWKEGDARALPFPNELFDAVFAHKVIHQFSTDGRRKMVAEAARILRRGGLFALSDVSVGDPEYGRGFQVEPDTFEHPDRHCRPIHYLSEESVAALLGRGWTIADARRVQQWERHPGEASEHAHEFLYVVARRD